MINIKCRSFAGGSPGQKLGRGHEAKGKGKSRYGKSLIWVLISWFQKYKINKYETRNLQLLVKYYTISPHQKDKIHKSHHAG